MTNDVTATELRLEGKLASNTFGAWICHRAALLDLKGWVTSEGPETMCIVVVGPSALIDAMEMACSLGPMDVTVTDVLRHERQLSTPPQGFKQI